MGNGARLLLIEWVLPGSGGDTDDYAFWDTTTMDIVSLIVSSGSQGGHVRTEAEFRALLAGAGLQLAAIVPTSSSVKVLEAVPDS